MASFCLGVWPQSASYLLPRYIVAEATNKCNLRCPVCATANAMRRPGGEMSIDLFACLLSQITWKIKMINFGYSGEPLLNRQLFTMIRMANARGIPSGFDTNGLLVENYALEIIGSGLAYINIALDGLSQETLSQYRYGSDFKKIVAGIRALSGYKQSKRKKNPFISIQFLAMRHNQKDMPLIKKFAHTLGADEVKIKTFNPDMGFWLKDSKREAFMEKFLPADQEYSRYKKADNGRFISKKKKFCIYPFSSPVVLFNGDVSLCCLDFNGEHILGNIRESSLGTIWKSHRYNEYRKKVASKSLDICRKCTFDFSVNKYR